MLRTLQQRVDVVVPAPQRRRRPTRSRRSCNRSARSAGASPASPRCSAIRSSIRWRRRATPGSTTRRSPSVYTENLEWESLSRIFDYVLRLQMRDAVWRKLAIDDVSATRPTLAGRLPRPRRLHRVEPGARRRRARRARQPVRGAHARHDRGARRPGGQDHRRRGDVRLRSAGGHRQDRAFASRSGPVTTRCCPTRGVARVRVGRRPGRRLLRAPSSNLADRLVELAYPGTVLASAELHDAIVDDPGFTGAGPGIARFVTLVGSEPGRCEPETGIGRGVALRAHE